MEFLITTTHINTGISNQDYTLSMLDVQYCALAALNIAVTAGKFHPSALPINADDVNLAAFNLALTFHYYRENESTPSTREYPITTRQLERLFDLDLANDGALAAAITEYSGSPEDWITLLEGGYTVTTAEQVITDHIADTMGDLPDWLIVSMTIDYTKALHAVGIRHTKIDADRIVLWDSK